MVGVSKAHARRWNRVASAYPDTRPTPHGPRSTMQTVVMTSGPLVWNSYAGITTVDVTREGIGLRLMLPFSAFHRPIRIPFRAMHVEPARWRWMGKSHQITVEGVDDVRVLVPDRLMEWISQQAAGLAASAD